MTDKIDLEKYTNFVAAVTSVPSNDLNAFIDRCVELETTGNQTYQRSVNMPLLLTSCLGLAAESGEFTEIVKKMVFQGKPLNDDNFRHMMLELGDVMWYWVNACRALDLDPNVVIAANVGKLKARYPGGEFDPYMSENRRPGDL
jgi:NTP pyrophosphatase (non-canonical NTP hydrolase)